jgi:hypothetical protein
MYIAGQIQTSVNVRVLSALLLMLLASSAVFSVLVRRWTTQRRRASLEEWARAARLKFTEGSAELLPSSLERLKPTAEAVMLLDSKEIQIVRVSTLMPAIAGGAQHVPPLVWKLLIISVRRSWSVAGMRPEGVKQSVLDLFSLSSFPALGGTERFVVYAVDSDAASALPQSTIRSLLPSDLGLLMQGNWMILDFSSRPFDELECERLISLAKQLAQHIG